jgi:transcriptional regulator with XRE-family HTH domain
LHLRIMSSKSIFAREGKMGKGRRKRAPISQALRSTIRDQGLTAYAAAKRAGTSVDTVQRFLNKKRGLNLATVDKLAGALELTLCPEETPPDHATKPA